MGRFDNYDHPLFHDPLFCDMGGNFCFGFSFAVGFMAAVFSLPVSKIDVLLDEFKDFLDRGEIKIP